MSVLLGAIADDFTGATDLANTLVAQGMPVLQVNGVPADGIDLAGAKAVVVALKSRTAPVAEAVATSLAACDWLQSLGVRQFLFKYCSTFDSTAKGNIGPVADALLARLQSDFALVCPAFPKAGRTIYHGHLFVGDSLLADSSMKAHPLTPMLDSNLQRLLAAQSQHPVGLIDFSTVSQGAEAVRSMVETLRQDGITYGVVDIVSDADLWTLAKAARSHKLLTGGSGIALGLPQNFRQAGQLGPPVAPAFPDIAGGAAVLAGSCSRATRAQINYIQGRWPVWRLDIDRIAEQAPVVAETLTWAAAQAPNDPILIYGSAEPAEVTRAQTKYGRGPAGTMMEEAMGAIAQGLVAAGCRRLIVAGGETSGAVVSALRIQALKIGREIDPGVPWTEAVGPTPLALALKSGNFGGDEFFEKAFGLLS